MQKNEGKFQGFFYKILNFFQYIFDQILKLILTTPVINTNQSVLAWSYCIKLRKAIRKC